MNAFLYKKIWTYFDITSNYPPVQLRRSHLRKSIFEDQELHRSGSSLQILEHD